MIGLSMFLIVMVAGLGILLFRAVKVITTAKRLKEYMLMQDIGSTPTSLDSSSSTSTSSSGLATGPNSTTKYSLRDITFSILESSFNRSSPSQSPRVEDIIRVGRLDLPLMKYDQTSFASKSNSSSLLSKPIQKDFYSRDGEDEEDDLSSIIASNHSLPQQSLHSSVPHHQQQQMSPQNVIGMSPLNRQERIPSLRQMYGTTLPKSNIVLVLPSTDKRRDST